MNKPYKKIAAFLLGVFSSALGFFIFLQVINVVDIRMLKAGYLEGSGSSQFGRVYMGIPLFLVVAIAWIGLVIFCFDYYLKGVKDNNLLKRFSLITAIELYLIPGIILLYQVAFPMNMTSMDWIIVGAGLFLGSLFFYLYSYRKTS